MLLPVVLLALAAQQPPAADSIEDSSLRQLLTVRRVYVDRLTGGETAAQMRDILIGSMAAARLFVVTENQERADAVLRGAAKTWYSPKCIVSRTASMPAPTWAAGAVPAARAASLPGSASGRTSRITPPSGVTKRWPPFAW
jgi:hypothetical protein